MSAQAAVSMVAHASHEAADRPSTRNAYRHDEPNARVTTLSR